MHCSRDATHLKFRPIVAGCNCSTSRLSEFFDKILKPLTIKIKSYVKDSTDFLNKLPKYVPEDSELITFDVTSLYTSIPHTLGLTALEYWINKCDDMIDERFEKQFIIDAMEIILRNNTFIFDDILYLQICGTAMGTKVAPSYATLTMAYLEETEFYPTIETNINDEISGYVKENWLRYLDDCFLIWNNKWGSKTNVQHILNDMDENVKFTMESSTKEIQFLDICVYIENPEIKTDIYHKETDTFNYLDFRSCHPSYCKANIPFNMAKRICTIISDHTIKEQRLKELETRLLKRNYPQGLITKGIEKAKKLQCK